MFLTKRLPECEQWLKREVDKQYENQFLTLEKSLSKASKKAEDKEQQYQKD